jgi:hypothetical protein
MTVVSGPAGRFPQARRQGRPNAEARGLSSFLKDAAAAAAARDDGTGLGRSVCESTG